jgi:hypothetical protein
MRVLLNIAKAYAGQRKDEEHYPMHTKAFLYRSKPEPGVYMEAYKLLPQLYKRLGKNDSAYSYLQQYKTLEDSVLNKQFLWKLSDYKRQEGFNRQSERLSFLDKENKSKEDKLKQEAKLKWILIAGLLITLYPVL